LGSPLQKDLSREISRRLNSGLSDAGTIPPQGFQEGWVSVLTEGRSDENIRTVVDLAGFSPICVAAEAPGFANHRV
jgi:hypothetical protein